MKKGQIVEGIIERVDFPNKGILRAEDGTRVIVKNAIMGQKVSAAVNKVRKGKCEGRLLEVLEKSALELPEPGCVHYGICGGCTFQSLPYEEQLSMKEQQVKDLRDMSFYRSRRAQDRRHTAIRWSFHLEMNIRTGR